MSSRRLVGIDLGIASAHTVRVLDGTGKTLAKRKAWPTEASLADVEKTALAGAPEDTVLEVVMEPTGPAWLPIAVYFTARGHRVYRVSSAKAADLRRFLSRHTKTNGIDADTLARLPIFDPGGLQPLVLPGAELAALDRRVRATDRLTRAGAEHKRRIKDLVRQLLPMSPLLGDLGVADLAVLERYADPNALIRLGIKRLTALIAKASHSHQGADRAEQWLTAARSSVELYAGHPAVAFADLAAEVATEVRLLRAVQAELAAHAAAREDAYRWVDPLELARSLPGVAAISGPALVATIGDPTRFGNGKAFRSYTGLVPKASETGDTDRKGQPMSKAGSSLLRTTLIRAADNARHQDPQLARIYYVQMVERGKDHLGALCVVAATLAERFWTVMNRQMPYVICDTDGRAVEHNEAKKIIAEHWTVPPEVRARRRSKKGGEGPPNSPSRAVETGRPSPTTILSAAQRQRQPTHRLTRRSSLGNQKTFITNGPDADVIVVYAKLDEGDGAPTRDRKVLTFVLDKGVEGLSQGKAFKKMGMMSSPTGELFFDDVRLGRDRLLGETEDHSDGDGRESARGNFVAERIGVAMLSLGIINECLRICLDYAKQRELWGRQIADFQLIQLKLAKMEVARINVQNMVFSALEHGRAGTTPSLAEASAMKWYSSEAATEVAMEAVQLLGGNGYMAEYRVEQLARDAKSLMIYAGSNEVQITHVAKGLLRG